MPVLDAMRKLAKQRPSDVTAWNHVSSCSAEGPGRVYHSLREYEVRAIFPQVVETELHH